jgi:putative ABC transport system permease protein
MTRPGRRPRSRATSFAGLVLVGLGRNKRRTVLTALAVTVALFLFCALQGVLNTLEESIRVGSETRLATTNRISLVFLLPLSYKERIAAVPGVESVSWMNWFGGLDPKDRHMSFAQFAIDAPTFLPMFEHDLSIVQGSPAPPGAPVPAGVDRKLAAFMGEQTACIVGEGLMRQKGWKLDQTITLAGTIFPGNWPFTIRAVYRTLSQGFNEQTIFFHWKYLNEMVGGRMPGVGMYYLELASPEQAAEVAERVDALFATSSPSTRTETERAFQAGFISMLGNIPFALNVVGLAVVFAILLIAANSMMMAFRERTAEIGVLKTLGFTDQAVFGLVLAEAAAITLGGGLAGALLAKLLLQGASPFGWLLPSMTVYWRTVALGVAVASGIGAVSGLIPALRASHLRIVDAIRRVD